VLRLRAHAVREERAPFVVRGGPLVAVLATLAVLPVLSGLGRRDFRMLGGLLVVVAALAALRRDPRGARSH
jgi:hypothetical protein